MRSNCPAIPWRHWGGELNKRVKRSSLSVSDSLANEDDNVSLQSSLEISGGLSSSVSKSLGLCSIFDVSKVAVPPPMKRLCESEESHTPLHRGGSVVGLRNYVSDGPEFGLPASVKQPHESGVLRASLLRGGNAEMRAPNSSHSDTLGELGSADDTPHPTPEKVSDQAAGTGGVSLARDPASQAALWREDSRVVNESLYGSGSPMGNCGGGRGLFRERQTRCLPGKRGAGDGVPIDQVLFTVGDVGVQQSGLEDSAGRTPDPVYGLPATEVWRFPRNEPGLSGCKGVSPGRAAKSYGERGCVPGSHRHGAERVLQPFLYRPQEGRGPSPDPELIRTQSLRGGLQVRYDH